MAEVKAKRGAPDAATRRKNREARVERDSQEALLKGRELAAKNYYDYLSVLDKCARGLMEDATIVSQLSAAKTMKEYVEKMMLDDVDESKVDIKEALEALDKPAAPLISLVAKQG